MDSGRNVGKVVSPFLAGTEDPLPFHTLYLAVKYVLVSYVRINLLFE